jgi:hypothetical protein
MPAERAGETWYLVKFDMRRVKTLEIIFCLDLDACLLREGLERSLEVHSHVLDKFLPD